MSIARSSFLFSAGTLLSRFSGVLRESVTGAVFGASVFMDAYVVAFRIPNLLRDLLAEGALGSSFTKVYSSLCVQDKEAAEKLLMDTLQLVTLVSLCVTALGMIFAPQLVDLMTTIESTPEAELFRSTTVSLTQLMFPFIGFAAFGAVVQGALYQRGGFFLAAVAPILFNIGSIIGALWLGNIATNILPAEWIQYFGNAAIFGLAFGTLAGGAAQSGIQLWGIWSPLIRGRRLWPTRFPWSRDTKKVLMLMTPMVIAASSGQINAMVNTNFATSLGTGAVTWLNFAFRLVQLPIGMFGVAVGAAILPSLTKSITEAGGRVDAKSSREAINALDLVTWLMVPCMVFMYGSALDITRLIYQAGQFSPTDTAATAAAIQAYSCGLLSYGMLKVLNSYYYAVDRTRFPMFVSFISIACNYFANSFLVHKFGHEGLAMTASVTLTINALLLIAGMSRDGIQVNKQQVFTSIGLLLLAAMIITIMRHWYADILAGFSISEFVNIQPSTLTRKLDATLRLICDGVVVIGIFAGVGLARIRKTPRSAFAMLKRKSR